MDRLYYTYLIIKESLDYIPAIEIKGQLEEKYRIKVDVKTVYQAIKNINELSKYIYQKEIIKTKHRKGYTINEEFFNDGQIQYLWDSILYNNDLDQKEVNILLTKLQTLSSNKQLSRIQNQTIRQNDIRNYDLLLNMTTIIKAINEKKNIYLTFDEGYEAGYTPKILDVLKQNNVKATFFITAHYLNTQSDLVKQMIDEGHIVGNHTVNHKSMPSLTQEQINSEVMDLHKAIYSKFEYEMKYLRPPMGEYSQKTLAVTNSLGYTTVMWSFAYEDWNEKSQPDEEKSKQKILNNVHNGEIMLLHGNSKTNTNILDSIIKQIKQMGYEFKSLDEFE